MDVKTARARAEAMTPNERQELIAQWQSREHHKQQLALEATIIEQEIEAVASILQQEDEVPRQADRLRS